MSATSLRSTTSPYELDYCRNVQRELADFSAYFRGSERFDAVDGAVLNFVRMRVAILTEHMDQLEGAPDGSQDLIRALQATNCACCDFLIAWAPQALPIH